MLRRLSLLAITLMTATALVLAANPASWASDRSNFKASYSGTVQANPTIVVFAGAGNATRLGRVTTAGQALIIGPSDTCTGGIANIHTETHTNNDGDTVTISSDDVSCPIGPGVYHGTGAWTVIGGTGRFDGSSGQGSLDGYADFNADTFTITLTGTLSVPHGD
jgi:hypothetical protein